MKIAIIGAGAMGCIYGMYLSRQNEVLLVDVVKDHVDAINEKGLAFTHLDGTTEIIHRMKATLDTHAYPAQDLVILLTKGYQSEAALEANRMLIGEDTIVLSLQNGYGNADDILKHVPESQIVLGTSAGGAIVAGPGEILHKGQGTTNLGCLTEDQSNAQIVADLMIQCGVPDVVLTANVRELLWSKLFVNIGVNPICAITGQTNISISENPFSNQASRLLVTEAVEIANASGMHFDVEHEVQHCVDAAVNTAGNICSMLADVNHKRRTEVDRINGAVVSEAAKLGLQAPMNQLITALIHAKEQTY